MTDSIQTNHSSHDVVDPELEQLLDDAFDVPPIPRSLLKRLDAGIESEWGTSPRLADTASSQLGRQLVQGSRWVRSIPLAAVAAAMLVGVLVFWGQSPVFAWSQMVEALSKQSVVQSESENVQRWMAMSDGLLGEHSAASSHLWDVHRDVLWQRTRGTAQIRRQTLSAENATTDANQMFLAFLVGAHSTGTGRVGTETGRFDGVRLVKESSTKIRRNGSSQIRLDAEFVCDDERSISVQAFVDPETHLPIDVTISGDRVPHQQVAMSYPSVSAVEQRAIDFPSELPVVDVAPGVIQAVLDGTASGVDVAAQARTSSGAPSDGTTEGEPLAIVAPTLAATSDWKAVRVVDLSFEQVVQQVDDVLANLWAQSDFDPVEPAAAEELLRRVYLDLTGRTPTVSEVRGYLGDRSADRYKKLVDRLLNSQDHSTHLATTYRTFLIPESVDLTAFGGVAAFDKWLSQRFASNDSYDEVVRSLLLAEGRLSRSGPLLFYSAAKLDPDQLAARTSRVFLGMRLECAQCHDHPFEPWTQEDFWSYAAFFARISRPQGELETVSTLMRVSDIERGEVMLPDTETVIPPRFLNAADAIEDKKGNGRRQQLAEWLTSAQNPYFARAAANRVWGTMFGKGIVDPIDDFGNDNPPVSPELLEVLASHFINTNFNLRELFRTVALSQAYRLSSGAATVNENRVDLFAQMNVKTLTAEQVYDCITVATMPSGSATMGFNVERFGNSQRDAFLQQFRTPVGRSTEYQGGIPQSLTLMNGTLINSATGLASSGLLKSLDAPFFSNKQRVEVLYFATLSRRPTEPEWKLLGGYVTPDLKGAALKENLADILWALLNSAEFTMNH